MRKLCQSLLQRRKPYDKLETIVNIIYDFIEQIPGAFLDESAVVIPIK